jgi:hypothetical protein
VSISGKKNYKVISNEKAKLFFSLWLGAFVANCFFISKAVENFFSFIKSLKTFYTRAGQYLLKIYYRTPFKKSLTFNYKP